MKHKTATLSGALLDAAVALAEGAKVTMDDGEISMVFWPIEPGRICWADWAPSARWEQGGPIVERERIELHTDGPDWCAVCNPRIETGPTLLAAAMRAFVAAKMGPEVELP
jgi:hypothetical protein